MIKTVFNIQSGFKAIIIIGLMVCFGFVNKDNIAKIKQLYGQLNTHKEMDLVLDVEYFKDYFNKSGKPDLKNQLHYIVTGNKMYLKRQESLYMHNSEFVIYVDYSRKRINVKNYKKSNPLDKVGNEIVKNLNIDTLLFNSISDYEIFKENDSITLHQIQYNYNQIKESKIWMNESQQFFSKIEYKFLDDYKKDDEKFSKMVMEVKSFNHNPKVNVKIFSTSTYITKDSKGHFIPSPEYKGYQILKQ